MMLGGASVAVFALIAMIAYPAIGVIFGIIIAWVSSILLGQCRPTFPKKEKIDCLRAI